MVKVTTSKEEIACVFCGHLCSSDGRKKCHHFVSTSKYFGDPSRKETRYLFRFQEKDVKGEA